MTVSIGNLSTSSISGANLASMDLETALMAVQSQRASLLETQLASQIQAVQAKNDQIAKLNTAMGLMTKIQAQFPADAKSSDEVGKYTQANDYAAEKEINQALKDAGVTPFAATGGRIEDNSAYAGGMDGRTNKGELDGSIQQLKSQIDSLSNTQQTDMLRLQSLSNKRNEAFDVMTNFVKKMQDSRSSILSNMR